MSKLPYHRLNRGSVPVPEHRGSQTAVNLSQHFHRTAQEQQGREGGGVSERGTERKGQRERERKGEKREREETREETGPKGWGRLGGRRTPYPAMSECLIGARRLLSLSAAAISLTCPVPPPERRNFKKKKERKRTERKRTERRRYRGSRGAEEEKRTISFPGSWIIIAPRRRCQAVSTCCVSLRGRAQQGEHPEAPPTALKYAWCIVIHHRYSRG